MGPSPVCVTSSPGPGNYSAFQTDNHWCGGHGRTAEEHVRGSWGHGRGYSSKPRRDFLLLLLKIKLKGISVFRKWSLKRVGGISLDDI